MGNGRKCACQATLNPDGTCPYGCEKFRKPHAGPAHENAEARRREIAERRINVYRGKANGVGRGH